MSWKHFRSIFKKEQHDESRFILGLDLGNDTSVIAYYDTNHGPEVIDLSGGYGKPSVPTVMQYAADTREWVFGEYAVLNKGIGKDVTLSALMEKLGQRAYVDVAGRSVSVAAVLGLYLKELLSNVKNINPKAVIAGIVVSVPSYWGEEAKAELTDALAEAGCGDVLIGLLPDRDCVFSRFYFGRKPTREKVLMLDFGSRALRGMVYDVSPSGTQANIDCLVSFFDESIGTKRLNAAVSDLFTHFYCVETGQKPDALGAQVRGQIEAFTYQHKDLLFQKDTTLKPVRLYFNFAYPPFQRNLTRQSVDGLIAPFAAEMENFIKKLFGKSAGALATSDIDRVICVGGGFEMLWIKNCVEGLFPDSHIVTTKNAKAVMAEGAAILAAEALGVTANAVSLNVTDRSRLTADIGIQVVVERRKKFIPLAARDAFWWQAHPAKLLLINEKTDKPVRIVLYTRGVGGEMAPLQELVLDNLPIRPRGTTRIQMRLDFNSADSVTMSCEDAGFGELFPKKTYTRTFRINTKGGEQI